MSLKVINMNYYEDKMIFKGYTQKTLVGVIIETLFTINQLKIRQ